MREIQSGCVARPQSDVTPATIRSVRLNEINTQRQRGWFSKKKTKKTSLPLFMNLIFYTKAAAMHNHSKRTVLVSS